jgi:tagatose-1,6-bisphosphate aldolase
MGGSGFLAGRALWQDYFKFNDSGEKNSFLNNTLPKDLKKYLKLYFRHEIASCERK